MFPIKPLFDKVIVREIPVEELFTEEDKKLMPFGHEQMKLRNRQGIVVAVGPDAEKHVQVEDRVYFEDTAMYEQVFVRPVDEFRKGIDTFWQLRVHDLKGVAEKNDIYVQEFVKFTTGAGYCQKCSSYFTGQHICTAEVVSA